MANIEVTKAYVDDIVTTKDGDPFLLRVTEVHWRKDGDEFVKAGRTFYKLKRGWESSVNIGDFGAGDEIEFSGKMKTEENEHNGTTYRDLVVAADSIKLLKKGKVGASVVADTLGGFEVDPDAPF